MKLRSGLSYDFKPPLVIYKPKIKKPPIKLISQDKNNKPVLNIYKGLRCNICCNTFSKGDYICSCSIKNINKHAFHKKCLKKWFSHINIPFRNYRVTDKNTPANCPYCCSKINKLEFVKLTY